MIIGNLQIKVSYTTWNGYKINKINSQGTGVKFSFKVLKKNPRHSMSICTKKTALRVL